jgi:hypothetical protein
MRVLVPPECCTGYAPGYALRYAQSLCLRATHWSSRLCCESEPARAYVRVPVLPTGGK